MLKIAWLDSRSELILGLLLAGLLSSGDSVVLRTVRCLSRGYRPGVWAGSLDVFFGGPPGA